MQYQRRQKENNIENEEEDKNKPKKLFQNNYFSSKEKQDAKIASLPINISKIKKKDIKRKENIIAKITHHKIDSSERLYKKIESPSFLAGKKSDFRRINLSTRYHYNNQIENSPLIKDQFSGIEDNEYNVHTLNARKSPDNISYTRYSIDDKPIKIKSINPIYDAQTYQENETYKSNMNENPKNIAFNTFTKTYRQPMVPQNKMSPIQHYDDGNSSYENKGYTDGKYRYTNNYTTKINPTSNIENINLNISNIKANSNAYGGRNTFGRLSNERYFTDANSPSYNNERVHSQSSNHVSYKELKNIVKKFNKVYDPHKNQKGLLIKSSQVTLPGASDEVFNNRYRVLSKMNKLSNILLAKQKNLEEEYNSSRANSNEKKERERSRSKSNNSQKNKKSKKLLMISLAMMGKDINDEERTILRKNRNDKGGVVDLAQEKIAKKNKFKIVKASKISGGKILKSNQKYRERAAKIIQAWWKELKDIYNYKLLQIIKIQSVWKGRWVRKNIYDLLYLNYLYLSFCEKIENVLKNQWTRYAFDKLKQNKKRSKNEEKEILKKIVLNADKNRILIIKKYWDIWINQIENEKIKKNKGKNLIRIRADKENKLGKLRTAFTIWKYNTKMEKIKYLNDDNSDDYSEEINGRKIVKMKKIIEKERSYVPGRNNNFIEKDKFKGLLFILDGANKYHKKQAYGETKPKLIEYLKNLAKITKLKNLINKKHTKIINILKKIIYKWLTKAIKLSSFENEYEYEYVLRKTKPQPNREN